MRPGSWTARAASPWTWACDGDHLDTDLAALLRGAGRDLGHPDRVGVVGEDDHLGGAALHDRVEDLPGRRTLTGASGHDDGARLLEERGQTRPRGDGDDLAAGAGRGPAGLGGLLGELVGEVGDADAVGPPGLDAGLDRRPHVVDVDVDVPESFAADHDETVPEAGQRLLEHRDRGVLGVEEIHHLVGGPVGREVSAATGERGERHRDAMHPDRCRRWSPARRDRLGGVQDDAEPATARVDDACVGQHLELGGSAGQRFAGGRRSSGEDVPGAGAGHPGTRHGRVGCGAGHAEDGALDRLTDGGVGRIGRALHPFRGHDRVAVLARRLGQPARRRPRASGSG